MTSKHKGILFLKEAALGPAPDKVNFIVPRASAGTIKPGLCNFVKNFLITP